MNFMYKGIEFPTEEEMVEYIRDDTGSDSNISFILERTEKEDKDKFVDKFGKIEKITDTDECKCNYVIYTLCNGSMMYVSKNNRTTFNMLDALVTDFETAKRKAFFMSKNGHYEWKYLKI